MPAVLTRRRRTVSRSGRIRRDRGQSVERAACPHTVVSPKSFVAQSSYRRVAADIADVIRECEENQLISALEAHETTGYGEEAAASALDQAVDYWID